MTEGHTFRRKIAYLGIIVGLLVPLSFISQPETKESKGGQLAQLRSDYRLSQANLGDIDPASETMKLATLGLRPVAVVMLWENAAKYKMKEDFTNLAATLEQITKLQPNFIKVWDFQAHNITYNVSAEFDDYHDRYIWVKKGLEFLIRGTEYNRDSPLLLSRVGFFVYHKIGKSDEKVQYREMFRQDDDLQEYMNARSDGWLNSQKIFDAQTDRDSWIVAHKWYKLSEDVVDRKGKPSEGTAPVIFHSDPAMMLINYAATIEQEGTFGDKAINAWNKANTEFDKYGQRDIQGAFDVHFRLGDKEKLLKRAEDLLDQVTKLLPPGAYDELMKQKKARLTEEERVMLDVPQDKLTKGQKVFVEFAMRKMRPTADELVSLTEEEHRVQAEKLAKEVTEALSMADTIDGYRGTVNYDYWKARCTIEPMEIDEIDPETNQKIHPALDARKAIYEASREADRGNLLNAKRLYDKGWNNWKKVLDLTPTIREDDITGDDMMEEIDKYYKLLQGLDQDKGFPNGFVLQELVEKFDKSGRWRKTPIVNSN